ncbi:MAG: hypothetical protein K2J68_01335 [Treponemataceae bacterium]|nr:hypothetical protein [Treponemataceae bacterium]
MKFSVFTLLFILIFLLAMGGITSCDNDSSSVKSQNYPTLKIVSNYSGYIYRVGLAGYAFEDLRIQNNESKSFELVNGIPGGNFNVNVNIAFRPDEMHYDPNNPLSIKCNFQNGKVTTITIPSGKVTISD